MNNNYKITKNEHLKKQDIISYGMGGFASTMPNQFKAQFSMNFMTDIAGIPIQVVGLISMLVSIWDAINDLFIGKLIDRTNTKKWGKYRPHMIFGSIGLSVTLVLQFYVPNVSLTWRIAYYSIVMTLLSVFFTEFTVPWQALNSILSRDPHERNLLLTSRQLTGAVATSIVGLFIIPLVSIFDSITTCWFCAAILIAVILIISAIFATNSAKKKDYYMSIKTPPKGSLKDQLNVVIKNPAVICASLMLGIVNLGISVNTSICIYYLRYVVKDVSILAIISGFQICLNLIILPFLPKIMKQIGKIPTLCISMFIQFISTLALFFLRENAQNIQVILISIFTTTGLTLANVCCFSLLPDCTDYTELHFGSAQAGFINAVSTFVRKLCGSFSTLMVANLLAFSGYTPNMPIPQTCIDMIINIKVFFPLITLLFILILSRIYPITSQYAKEMHIKIRNK